MITPDEVEVIAKRLDELGDRIGEMLRQVVEDLAPSVADRGKPQGHEKRG